MPLYWLPKGAIMVPSTPSSLWYTNQTATASATAPTWLYNSLNQTAATGAYSNGIIGYVTPTLSESFNFWCGHPGYQARAPFINHADIERRQAERDQADYRRALAEHNDQEVTRLRLVMEQRAAERQQQLRIAEERRREATEREQQRIDIDKRANDLLVAHLTKEQREMVAAHGWFIVEGGRSKTRYRIRTGSIAGNIDVFDRQGVLFSAPDKIVASLCCHADHSIPRADHILSQKLMLEHSEDDFLRLANRTRR